MRRFGRTMLVYLNDELADWLEGKALEGYKKTALIRYILEKYKKAEPHA